MRTTMIAVVLMMVSGAMASTATFEDLPLAAESFYNGSDRAGGFTSGGLRFDNNYDVTFGSWDGFAYSNITDNTTPGWGNQYSAITGGGVGGSSTYGVGYIGFVEPPTTSLANARVFDGLFVTNNTYAYLSMRDGDAFAKKFGGVDGNDADWLLLTITGFNGLTEVGAVDFYLADYRFADNAQDYLVDQWTWVDLSSLGDLTSLEFSMSSTDNGEFGMNTPAYFAVDNVVPEPATMALLTVAGAALLRRRK
ncbi:MAG: DUF4465 domain-containing protein [Planctomycetota bacterium]